MKKKAIAIYRPMKDLTESEKDVLRTLTIPHNPGKGKRSVFRYWLDYYSGADTLHTVLIKYGKEIVGWAAANMGDIWNRGVIGVFMAPWARGKGYAKMAVKKLLDVLAVLYPDGPRYIYYQNSARKVFAPLIANSVFKDWQENREEFERAYRIARPG